MIIKYFYKVFSLLLIPFALMSCKNDDDGPVIVTPYQEEVIDYFVEIALGFEHGNSSKITRKWNQEMKVFVGGNPSQELSTELDIVIQEINDLVTDGFQISITADSLDSNYYIFFGSGDAYAKIFPHLSDLTKSNWGLFNLSWGGSNYFTSGRMYVDIERAGINGQKHLLREELTQSLGLANDSYKYPESIFQQDWTTTTSYSSMDKELIRLLYHPKMPSGLSGTTLKILLLEILQGTI